MHNVYLLTYLEMKNILQHTTALKPDKQTIFIYHRLLVYHDIICLFVNAGFVLPN